MRADFTERDVDLCLQQAACIRGSYGGHNSDGSPRWDVEDDDIIQEAVEWDALARKIAEQLGPDFELERQCSDSFCRDGRVLDRVCLECVGTGVIPPVAGPRWPPSPEPTPLI
jgi:hypothetical protein